MKATFKVFETIKNVLSQNNSRITKFTDLALLYLGFCEHFISYLDAYEILYKQKNYYACKAIDRIVLDLYIKTRLLAEVYDSEDLANWLWKGNKIKKYKSFIGIQGDLTDIALCRYFDKQDYNYSCYPGTKEKIMDDTQGQWEKRYREKSDFIHPNKQSAIEYWKKYKWPDREKQTQIMIEEDEEVCFELLANDVAAQLSEICSKILIAQ